MLRPFERFQLGTVIVGYDNECSAMLYLLISAMQRFLNSMIYLNFKWCLNRVSSRISTHVISINSTTCNVQLNRSNMELEL